MSPRTLSAEQDTGEQTLFLGVDPGMKGGLAVVTKGGDVLDFVPMPDTRKGISDFMRKYVGKDVVAVVELVHSMPGQGVSSTFKFGKGCGVVLGAIAAFEFKVLEPTPQAWKKKILAGTDKSKDASIQVCENLFPGVDLVMPRCRKPHDGVAEAILLAEYGRRTHV